MPNEMPKENDLLNSEKPEDSPMRISVPSSRRTVIEALAALSQTTPEAIGESALLIGLAEMAQRQNSLNVFERFRSRD